MAITTQQVASALAQAKARWQAKSTPQSSLPDEVRRRLLGAVPSPAALAQIAAPLQATAPAFAPAVDWRNHNGNNITPIKDQGGCGSCVSFASCALTEAMGIVERGVVLDLSDADSHFCSNHGANCGGWWPDQCLDQIITRGVCDEAAFPYASAFPNNDIWSDPPACRQSPDRNQRAVKIARRVQLNDATAVKNYLTATGPVAGCFTVFEDFFSYSTGVYHHVTGVAAGGHCVLVVGYSEANGAWICKNSWGPGWGNGGFFEIAYQDMLYNGQFFAMYGAQGVVIPKPPARWSWANQDTPAAGVSISGPVGVLTMKDTPSSAQRPYGFVLGSDGRLWVNWWSGSQWNWANQGVPAAGVSISAPIGVLTMMDTPTSVQRPYVFVRGSDGHLWVNWWNGSQWNWANQGGPPAGVVIRGPVGALTMMDTPTSVQRPYVFVQGSDGHLWVNWWNGSQWNWANQGAPAAGVGIRGPVGVLTVKDTPTSAQRPYAFVIGSDGHVWVNWWNGSQWHWSHQGVPGAGVNISAPIGVLTMMDTPTSAQRPYVFVLGSDGHLWVNWWNGSQWNWANQGAPAAGVGIKGPAGALTMMDTPTSVQRPYVFVLGSDGHLWVNWWNGSQWNWANQGAPATGVSASGSVGALTMMDTPTATQRPYVFVLGSDKRLYINWWG